MKSAIIGCGNIARVHAEVISLINPGGLAAVADCDRGRAEELAKRYGARACGSLEEVLANTDVDVVHICTPHFLHVPMAVMALREGVSVFLEKPPAVSFGQWEELTGAADEAYSCGRGQLGLCFQNRYNDNVQYVRQQLSQGAYGRILGARGIVTWDRDSQYYRGSGWKGRLATEGGGVLINQAIHTLDLMQYLIGERPLSMEAAADNQHLQGVVEVEDSLMAYFTYPSARACLYVTNSYVCDAPPLLELECERARVRLEDIFVTIWDKAAGGRKELDFPGREGFGKSYWGAGHLQAIREFYDCVRSGRLYPMNVKALENTVWLMLKAYERARAKEPQPHAKLDRPDRQVSG